MQIQTIPKGFESKFESYIRKGFEAFEWKFEPFEKDWKHSNANSNHLKGIRSVQKRFEAFESKP